MGEGCGLVTVRIRPRSSRAGVMLGSDGGVVISVHAPAAEGAANRECLALLAKALGVPKSAVRIARGAKSRVKQVAVANLDCEEVAARLERAAREGQRQ